MEGQGCELNGFNLENKTVWLTHDTYFATSCASAADWELQKHGPVCSKPTPTYSSDTNGVCDDSGGKCIVKPRDMLKGLIRVMKARGYTKDQFKTMDEYEGCSRSRCPDGSYAYIDGKPTGNCAPHEVANTGVCVNPTACTDNYHYVLPAYGLVLVAAVLLFVLGYYQLRIWRRKQKEALAAKLEKE
jgi:hypothetical protein